MQKQVILLICAALSIAAAMTYFSQSDGYLRGETVKAILAPIVNGKDVEKAMVASAILGNYTETRQIAAHWSGLYWGFAWAAAVLGALSGLILKLESLIPNEKVKKDISALLAVTSAIMITISTGGDFQRKWQANRAAAADIEHLGYEFISKQGENPREYLGKLSEVLKRRHMSILGTPDSRFNAEGRSESRAK